MALPQLADTPMVEMIVVRMRDANDVDFWDICDRARRLGVAFRSHELYGAAAVGEDGVEEHAEAAGEFDVVAGVAEPGCAELCVVG